jgi:hypothetical protein
LEVGRNGSRQNEVSKNILLNVNIIIFLSTTHAIQIKAQFMLGGANTDYKLCHLIEGDVDTASFDAFNMRT